MPQCPAAVDAGFKFNLLGWTIHAIGQVNEAGQYGLCALGMTSTMEGSQVKEMLKGFRDSTARVTPCNPNKKFAMSDVELAYCSALSEVFQSDNLMCFFHVKQAARDHIMAHCHGKQEAKEETWQSVSADISLLRGARTEADFRSRCVAMEAKWDQEGLAAKTA